MIHLSGHGPLHRQVYLALRQSILSGELRRGARLPSSRALAEELAVSRTITQLAYEQLIAEGYLTGRVGSGTYVAEEVDPQGDAAEDDAGEEAGPPQLSRAGRRVLERSASLYGAAIALRGRQRYDFRPGLPPLSDFPHERWRRMLGRQARRLDGAAYEYPPAKGLLVLRDALAQYLRRSRALSCDAEQIVIVGGSQQGLDLAARLLLDPDDRFLIEEPGYEGARNVFSLTGAAAVPATVDEEGIAEPPDDAGIRLAYVTPSHQYPTGAILSLPRRLALLSWADRSGAYILEDDYDGEFRYTGRPLAPLKALDRSGRVIYLGTFSKVMFPALRLGYLVLPRSLVRVFARAKPLADGGTSPLLQATMADFVSSGSFELYVRRLRSRMRERRQALLDAIDGALGSQVAVAGADAGLHVLLRWKNRSPQDIDAIVAAAAERGVGVYSASPYYVRAPEVGEMVVGYAAMTPAAIRSGVRRLAEAAGAAH
ncbi:MAG TPA: PLP-dependent aminotransferase family protein [Candidatus Limnocylindrales bacterium]|nr:PLP-dependent aminotransferase family protein [Candidatus Limnocylindrales bacterium]